MSQDSSDKSISPDGADDQRTLENERLKQENQRLRQENELLKQKVDLLVRRIFGAKSEKLDAQQLLLLLAAEDEPGKQEEPVGTAEDPRCSKDESTPSKPSRRERRGPRWPEHLPVCEEVILPEPVKANPEAWERIGEEVSQRLDYKPARFLVLRTVRPKYVAKHTVDAAPVIAPLPPTLLEGSIVTPGLLAQVVTAKYCDHLPLYRQEAIYWRSHQVWLPRQTMAEWVGLAAFWLKPVYDKLSARVFGTGYVQIDESPVRYLAPNHGRTKLGYLWTCLSPAGGEVVYHWRPSRAASALDEILPNTFCGAVQCDGYEAYATVARKREPQIKLARCMAHVRRKFREAAEAAQWRSKDAAFVLRLIQSLYKIEKLLRDERAGPRLRQARRYAQARPLLGRLHGVLRRWKDRRKHLPQSAMGKAINYALNEWPGLLVYLEDGRVEIDNNLVENAIRPTAVGKKNWLFFGGAEAGERSAVLYTIIETCRRLSIDPYEYLTDVFTRLPSMTSHQIDEILPAHWLAQRAAASALAKAA